MLTPHNINVLEFTLQVILLVINRKNKNLAFLFVLLMTYKLFDVFVLSPQMRVISPFYLEHLIESGFNLFVCYLIYKRAIISRWVHYDCSYLGYMQEFGLISVYLGYTLLSFALFCEGVLYWYTDFVPYPLPLFSIRLYFLYSLLAVEYYILVSLTYQNLTGTLPQKYSLKV